ncbi:MAG: response regulator receiver protein [Pedosphaera sp.]|nr:response regulator receiver protein [Pedosphaera sp.]
MKSPNAAILLVDDSPDDLDLLKIAFRAAKVANPILSVNSGNEAIAYLNGEGKFADRTTYPYPTFILTDLKMPNGDGFSVLENLKKNPEWAVIPTVVMSGSADHDDIKRSYMLGASSYFIKPGDYDALKVLMQTLHNYWKSCETPATDTTGKRLETDSRGKLGARFAQADQANVEGSERA